jgi:hypothetical protein
LGEKERKNGGVKARGKRVGSWGKKKVIQKQEAHPAKWMSLKGLK